jgi:hypothetical protein
MSVANPEGQSVDDWLLDFTGATVTPIKTQPPVAPVSTIPSTNESDDEGVVEEKPLLPEGEYPAWYLEHKKHPNFKGYGDKLVVSFRVDECGYAGEIVSAFYNITITEKGWKAKGGSRWVKEMRRLFPDRKRKDRLPVLLLKNKKVLIEVRTVITGKAKRVLEEAEQYSVVDSILRLLN